MYERYQTIFLHLDGKHPKEIADIIQKTTPTYGKHPGVKLIGTLNYTTGEIFCIEEERYDAKTFLKFLKLILEKYKGQRVVIILDNARIHHAKSIQPFLGKYSYYLELVFLPPYSPNLNPIEKFGKWLKQSCIYNVFYSSVKEIQNRVEEFIKQVNQNPLNTVDRLCLSL